MCDPLLGTYTESVCFFDHVFAKQDEKSYVRSILESHKMDASLHSDR